MASHMHRTCSGSRLSDCLPTIPAMPHTSHAPLSLLLSFSRDLNVPRQAVSCRISSCGQLRVPPLQPCPLRQLRQYSLGNRGTKAESRRRAGRPSQQRTPQLHRSQCSPTARWRSTSVHHYLYWPACVRRERSEEHTSELQSHVNLVCRLLLEKKK